MMILYRFFLFFIFLFFIFFFSAPVEVSQSAYASTEDVKLVVDVSIFKPSVMENSKGELVGFDIEIWENIADEAGLTFEYKKVPFKEIFEDLTSEKADVGISGISITEYRERQIDFSHPYLKSELRIMVGASRSFEPQAIFRSFLKNDVRNSILYLMIFIVICGHIVWLAERGQDAINDNYFPGIFESFWWAFVTMTTVGYGDIAPKKWVGRIVGVVVMFAGIIFFGWFVAVLSSSIESTALESKITTAFDLRGKKIATIDSTTSLDFLKKMGSTPVTFSDLEHAVEALRSKKVKAVVYDKPPLEYFLSKSGSTDVVLVGESFNQSYYGFALRADSPFRERINRALLHLIEDGTYQMIFRKYFGQVDPS